MILSRRNLLASSAALLLQPQRLKMVVAGGHPGDPECGCAGTVARYTAPGHDVTLLYLNRGEGYCGGAPLPRCAEIRTAEATEACRILKARALFADQTDGAAVVDNAHYESFGRILAREKPDIVFTQWPIDTHRDHRAVSALTLDAWLLSRKAFSLYYYEVAEDTNMFTPTDFVDISSAEALRRDACYAHASQQPDKWYPQQTEITRRHGAAEGFLRHADSRPGFLP